MNSMSLLFPIYFHSQQSLVQFILAWFPVVCGRENDEQPIGFREALFSDKPHRCLYCVITTTLLKTSYSYSWCYQLTTRDCWCLPDCTCSVSLVIQRTFMHKSSALLGKSAPFHWISQRDTNCRDSTKKNKCLKHVWDGIKKRKNI